MRHSLLTIVLASFLIACSAPVPGGDDGGNNDGGKSDAGSLDAGTLAGLCAAQRVEAQGLVVCEQLYPVPPYIRPPADSPGETYVGFADLGNGFVMHSRARTWPLPAAFSALIDGTSGAVPYATTLYRASVSGDSVSGLVPVARIEERLFVMPFAGQTLEGQLSVRADGGGSFDFQNLTVPARVQLDTLPDDAGVLGGRFVNFNAGVRAASGACLPALTSWGEGNPLFGISPAPERLAFSRFADMHGGHDDVVVMQWAPTATMGLGNTMTPSGYVSVPNLLLAVPLEVSSFGGGFTHGNPSSAPSASTFQVVNDGGAPCP